MRSVNQFGLFHDDDVAQLLLRGGELEPFVAVDAVVVEVMDLSADKTRRHLTIRPAPAEASKLSLELDELF